MRGKPRVRDFDARMARAREDKQIFEQEQQIREIRRSMRRWKPPTTTKILMAYIFGNCTVVEIYSMWVMWALADISALYALVTAVITESISFAVYCAKAYNETKQEELVKLERDKMAASQAVEQERERLADDRTPPESNEGADPEYGVPENNEDENEESD